MSVDLWELMTSMDKQADILGRHVLTHLDNPAYTPSKVPGREGTPTNLEALRDYTHNSVGVYSLIDLYRRGFQQEKLTLDQLITVTCALFTTPLYLENRRNKPIKNSELPPFFIDASRAAFGIVSILTKMFDEGVPLNIHLTPELIFLFASGINRRGVNYFIAESDNRESCPAREIMVKGILGALINRPSQDMTPEAVALQKQYLSPEEIARSLRFGRSFFFYTKQFPEKMYLLEDPESAVTGDSNYAFRKAFSKHTMIVKQTLGYD